MASTNRVPYALTKDDLHLFDLASKYEENEHGEIIRCGSFFTSYYFRLPTQASGWTFDSGFKKPWQLRFHHDQHQYIVVIGGYGTGKTIAVGLSRITWATLRPWFKFLNVAPTQKQSETMYELLMTQIEGSIWGERFLLKAVEKPYPAIHIRVKHPEWGVYNSKLEFMSSADDANRIKNYEGDMANIDQAEQQDDLDETTISLVSRLRGTAKTGRVRDAILSYIANSADSPQLWYLFDQAEVRPNVYSAYGLSSYDNGNVTEKQLMAWILSMGDDPQKIEQHLKGGRPTGGGIEFSLQQVDNCTDTSLDTIMDDLTGQADWQDGSDSGAFGAKSDGVEYRTDDRAGVVLWALPPEKNRQYVVVGDPGQGRPPGRNAPVVMVFDITAFPLGPIALRAFWWGNGGGLYSPFLNQFKYWLAHYRCAFGGYDSTGGQKVHSELSFADNTNVIPIGMEGVKKNVNVVILKLLMTRSLLAFPKKIMGISYQFLRYKMPDTKIAQDIVAGFMVLAGLIAWLGFDEYAIASIDEGETALIPNEEAANTAFYDRDSRPLLDRYERPLARV